MGQPQRTGDVRAEPCDVCPECHGLDTTVTLKSATGVYCRCKDCGHVWHQERLTH
jgi:hypothetical protein